MQDRARTDLVARVAVSIAAAPSVVWLELVAPETIPKMMPVEEVIAPWRPQQSFAWRFDLAGRLTQVDGFVHRMQPDRLLEFDYVDVHSRDILGVENVHRVLIELTEEGESTRISVTQDAHVSEAARAHAAGGWRLALYRLKVLVEGLT